MDRYFVYINECGNRVIDEDGFMATDLDGAIRKAVAGVREIMAAEVLRGLLRLNSSFDIVDTQGTLLHTQQFKDLVLVTDR